MKPPLLIIVSIFSYFSCKAPEKPLTEWTSKMTFAMFYYGGMDPEAWDMIIAKDSCIYSKRTGPNVQNYTFRLDQQKLNGLLKVLNENNITKMQMRQHDVIHDKATSGFMFMDGTNEYRISPGATESLEKKWLPNFKAINEYANKLCWDELNKQRKEFVITMDTSIQRSNMEFHISFDHGEKSFHFKKDSIPSEVKTSILPGDYEVQIHLVDESKQGQERHYASWMETLKTEGKDGVVLKLVGKEIVVE